MTKKLHLSALLIFASAALSACSHTITLRASHFATPIVADDQWQGQLSIVGTAVTKVTLVTDVTSNPPRRDSVLINNDTDFGDLVFAKRMSIDGRLTVWESLEAYIDGSLWGLRYQFLNHKAAPSNWVASALLAHGGKKTEVSSSWGSTTAESTSNVKTYQGGLSVGYKYEEVVPYLSYIYEKHETETEVTGNTYGTFGPYSDSGNHQYFGIGVTSYKKGVAYAIEYNKILIDWNRSGPTSQDSLGLKVGLAW